MRHYHRYRRRHKGSVKCTFLHVLFFICLLIHIGIIILNIIINVMLAKSFDFDQLYKIKSEIFTIPPLFNFNIGLDASSSNYSSYKKFYTWQGTVKTVKSGRSRRIVTDISPVLINKIYNNKFFYQKINKTYFDYMVNSVTYDQSCQENYKKCGILDTNYNILCLPKDEECPLNDIKVSNEELPELLPEYTEIKVVETLTDANKYFYFTNNKTDNKIITHFELSSNKPCMDPDEHNWISVFKKEKEKTCSCETSIDGKLYDPAFFEVGNNILMKPLYYDNKIPIYNYSNNNEVVNLYARNYYYVDKKCTENYIVDYEDYENYYTDKFLIIRILQYIEFGLFTFYFVCLSLSLCLKTYEPLLRLIIIILGDLIIIYGIIINIFLIVFVKKSKLDFTCGGNSINFKIDNIFNDEFSFNTVFILAIVCLILGVVHLIINTFML